MHARASWLLVRLARTRSLPGASLSGHETTRGVFREEYKLECTFIHGTSLSGHETTRTARPSSDPNRSPSRMREEDGALARRATVSREEPRHGAGEDGADIDRGRGVVLDALVCFWPFRLRAPRRGVGSTCA
jgi:hypothetical protein